MTKTEVEKQAQALPEEERVELAYALLRSATPVLTKEQEEEVTRRMKAYREDPSILVSEEEAHARLRKLVNA